MHRIGQVYTYYDRIQAGVGCASLRWYIRNKLFLLTVSAEQAGLNEEVFGFIWHFSSGAKASMTAWIQEQTPVKHFQWKVYTFHSKELSPKKSPNVSLSVH